MWFYTMQQTEESKITHSSWRHHICKDKTLWGSQKCIKPKPLMCDDFEEILKYSSAVLKKHSYKALVPILKNFIHETMCKTERNVNWLGWKSSSTPSKYLKVQDMKWERSNTRWVTSFLRLEIALSSVNWSKKKRRRYRLWIHGQRVLHALVWCERPGFAGEFLRLYSKMQ